MKKNRNFPEMTDARFVALCMLTIAFFALSYFSLNIKNVKEPQPIKGERYLFKTDNPFDPYTDTATVLDVKDDYVLYYSSSIRDKKSCSIWSFNINYDIKL